MKGRELAGIIVGILFALSGGTFALQGDGMLGSGSFMDNNPSWIYIGSFMFLVGIVLIIFSLRLSRNTNKASIEDQSVKTDGVG